MQVDTIRGMADLIEYLGEGGIEVVVIGQGFYIGKETDEVTFFVGFIDGKPSVKVNGNHLRADNLYILEGIVAYLDSTINRKNTKEELFKELSRDNEIKVLENGEWRVNDAFIADFNQGLIIGNGFRSQLGIGMSENTSRAIIRVKEYFICKASKA